MQWQIFLFIGAIAVATTLITLKGAFAGGIPRRVGLVVAIGGSIAWGYWGVGALEVTETEGGGCCTHVYAYEPLFVVGMGLMLVMFAVGLALGLKELEAWEAA